MVLLKGDIGRVCLLVGLQAKLCQGLVLFQEVLDVLEVLLPGGSLPVHLLNLAHLDIPKLDPLVRQLLQGMSLRPSFFDRLQVLLLDDVGELNGFGLVDGFVLLLHEILYLRLELVQITVILRVFRRCLSICVY